MLLKILSFSSILFVSGSLQAQSLNSIFGDWEVEKNFILEKVSGETAQEYNARIQKEKECTKAIFTIDVNGIRTTNTACDFFECDINLLRPGYKTVEVVEDNEYTFDALGNEMVDSNIIGRRFTKLLDKKYSKNTFSFFDTDCLIGYGNSTLKICIVNENRIGLYQDYSLIVLHRKRK